MNNVFFKNDSNEYNHGDFIVDKSGNIELQFGNIPILLNNNILKFNGTIKDFNDNLQAGIYNISGSSTNKPIGVNTGLAIVFDRITNFDDIGNTVIVKNSYVQLQIICTADKKVFFRALYNNSSKIESNIFELTQNTNSVSKLSTLYHGEKMKQEEVYNDFISYMDEKTLYDKQQRKLEQDRQLAYEQALEENPELTYEEFMSLQPMTLNLVEEPQPSENLKKFMEKYL